MATERSRRAVAEERLLCFNGIDGRTGGYLLPPSPPRRLADLARGAAGAIDSAPARARELRAWAARGAGQSRRGLREGLDPRQLEEAGWGAIFPPAESGALRAALAPLLELRRAQAGRLYRELAGDDGYREGETKLAFLARHGAGPGAVDPQRVPYYLLLVGDPEAIPFSFQYQLDVQYAVGRLCFDDLDGYRRYAEGVVAAESGRIARRRRASFFAPANAGDAATAMTSEALVAPMVERTRREQPAWEVESAAGAAATRDRLGRLLGDERPAFLFAACHGLGFPSGDPWQRDGQGALVCQDWPGPAAGGIDRAHYLAAGDVGDDAHVDGLIAFCFACYGAGTPRWDELGSGSSGSAGSAGTAGRAGGQRQLAPASFVGRLPQRLLSHPGGGALAVVGHVDRAWGFSLAWTGAAEPQIAVFESAVRRLLAGEPVGWAMELFNQRYAEIASDLVAEREALDYGKAVDETLLADLWIASRDARNYTIVGDPAVRLAPAAV